MKRNFKLLWLLSIFTIILITACGDDDNPVGPQGNPVYNIRLDYYWHLDLDSNAVDSTDAFDPPTAPMDFYFAYNSVRSFHGVVFQKSGREIAIMRDRTFESVVASDIASASFTISLIDSMYDATTVLLLKTEMDAVFKLGNFTETADYNDGVTFDYSLLQAAP